MWYLNGNIAAEASWPYGFNWQLDRGTYSLTARSGGMESEPVHFEVR
jgi:membrane carboxypeptidase/penicillin-binding protein PbpC